MANQQIGMAKQDGSRVVVFDEKGRRLFSRYGSLHGYTSGTVSVQEGSRIIT